MPCRRRGDIGLYISGTRQDYSPLPYRTKRGGRKRRTRSGSERSHRGRPAGRGRIAHRASTACTLVEPTGLKDAPDLGETATDIAHRAVKDDVTRQYIVETLVGPENDRGDRERAHQV